MVKVDNIKNGKYKNKIKLNFYFGPDHKHKSELDKRLQNINFG